MEPVSYRDDDPHPAAFLGQSAGIYSLCYFRHSGYFCADQVLPSENRRKEQKEDRAAGARKAERDLPGQDRVLYEYCARNTHPPHPDTITAGKNTRAIKPSARDTRQLAANGKKHHEIN